MWKHRSRRCVALFCLLFLTVTPRIFVCWTVHDFHLCYVSIGDAHYRLGLAYKQLDNQELLVEHLKKYLEIAVKTNDEVAQGIIFYSSLFFSILFILVMLWQALHAVRLRVLSWRATR